MIYSIYYSFGKQHIYTLQKSVPKFVGPAIRAYSAWADPAELAVLAVLAESACAAESAARVASEATFMNPDQIRSF